jgi:3-methylfumaryl-CoA hydratase
MSDGSHPEWLGDWEPEAERSTVAIAAHPVVGLGALLGVEPTDVAVGRPLPPLWHWVALSSWPRAADVGADGHPRTGGFLPRTPYPRRMWMGTTVEIDEPPLIGTDVEVERSVTDVLEKSGRQGPFALVTVKTVLRAADGRTLLTERNQLAYRNPAPAAPAPGADARTAAAGGTDPSGEPWLSRLDDGSWHLQPDPVTLMWFSALTANAHRIHYDRPYATDVEGYPSLLVHGPLMAMVLAEVARRDRPQATLRAITVRAMRPMFEGMQATVRFDGEDSLTLGPVGEPACMTAEVRT